jgi:DUF1009 family protein
MTTASTAGDATAVVAGEPLVLFAAEGALPVEVAAAATAAGRKLLVISLEGTADERLLVYPHAIVKWGQIGHVEQLVRAHGRDVVIIGTVTKRPDFANLGMDFGTLRYLPRILKNMVGGDDTILGNFVKMLEEMGFRVIGAHEVAPNLVATAGHMAGPRPSAAALADAALAMNAARAIGTLDIGQAAVAVGGRVVALEAAEGTDAMIERVGGLHGNGRVKWSGRSGVLAKRAKPQQDLRIDMPAIGPRTVEAVARAGLGGIVIESGRVIIAERAETVALAERTGTFITAVDGRTEAGPL